MCRTILIYENIYIPPELEDIFGKHEEGKTIDVAANLEKEIIENKTLIAAGDGDSSGGSESEPSEDNLPVDEAAKVVPIVDKTQKVLLQKIMKKKAVEEKEKEGEKPKVVPQSKRKEDASPARSPQPRNRSPTKKAEPVINVKPAVEPKEEKKKPVMRDACTQTERSDYQRIKK